MGDRTIRRALRAAALLDDVPWITRTTNEELRAFELSALKNSTATGLAEGETGEVDPELARQVRERVRRRVALGLPPVDCLGSGDSWVSRMADVVQAAYAAHSLHFVDHCQCLTKALDELVGETDVQKIRLRARALHKPRRIEKPEGGQTQRKPSRDVVDVPGPIVVVSDDKPKPSEEAPPRRALPRANAAQRSQVPELFRHRAARSRRSGGFLPRDFFDRIW